jgi:branched-subunit amino acid transport protein
VNPWIATAAAALVTLALRATPQFVTGRLVPTAAAQRALRHAGLACMVSLCVTAVSRWQAGATGPDRPAGGVAVVVAIVLARHRLPLWAVTAAGVVAFAGTSAVLP